MKLTVTILLIFFMSVSAGRGALYCATLSCPAQTEGVACDHPPRGNQVHKPQLEMPCCTGHDIDLKRHRGDSRSTVCCDVSTPAQKQPGEAPQKTSTATLELQLADSAQHSALTRPAACLVSRSFEKGTASSGLGHSDTYLLLSTLRN